MVTIDITIELLSPLLSGDWRLGNDYRSKTILPGSALRGALAETILQSKSWEEKQISHPDECPDPQACEFCVIFYPSEGEEPRFGDCLPAQAWDYPLTLPMTARTCKMYPGFINVTDPGRRHGVIDILIRQAAYEDTLRQGKNVLYNYEPLCPACGEKVVPLPASYYSTSDNEFYTAEPLNRRFSRTAIRRSRGTAESQLLYTLNVIGEQMKLGWLDEHGEQQRAVTTLRGQVWAGNLEGAKKLAKRLEEINWLGAVRSRGLGHVNIQATVVKREENQDNSIDVLANQIHSGLYELPDSIKDRFQNNQPFLPNNIFERILCFNWIIQKEREFWKLLKVNVLEGKWYFTVDLLSDLFPQELGVPNLQITPQTLGIPDQYLGDIEIIRSWIRKDYKSGWSGVKKLPRPIKLVVGAGSAYLFEINVDQIKDIKSILNQLLKLEENGIGEERERGAGRVMVCAPFHLEVEPR